MRESRAPQRRGKHDTRAEEEDCAQAEQAEPDETGGTKAIPGEDGRSIRNGERQAHDQAHKGGKGKEDDDQGTLRELQVENRPRRIRGACSVAHDVCLPKASLRGGAPRQQF